MSTSDVYTTDGKVRWFASEEDVNSKLASIIGKKFEDYRKKWDSANRFELETDFPLFLQLETSQICNLRCPSCPIGTPEAHEKYISSEKMDWSLYEKIILEGEKYGCPSLEPQGTNEPFLDKNLENSIKFASDHGFLDIMLNTNATLLSEERSRKILKSGITRFRFSLDAATKEPFEKVRLGANYDMTMRNIEKFLELKIQEQPWQRVLIRSNGEVCPCCAFFSEELTLGNVKERSIYNLWNSKYMKDLRHLHKLGKYEENPWCKKCVDGIRGEYGDSPLIKIKNLTEKNN